MNSKLRMALNEEQISKLYRVTSSFLWYDEEQTFKYLWNLTYKPEFALSKMNLEDEVFLTYHKKVRNFIFEQMENNGTLGLDKYYPNELFEKLQRDKFAAKRIMNAINEAFKFYPYSELERIEFLLSSDISEKQFGGLRSLKLNIDEANYFMPAVTEISNYFKTLLSAMKDKNNEDTGATEVVTQMENSNASNSLFETANSVAEEKTTDDIITKLKAIVKSKEDIEGLIYNCDLISSSNPSIIYVILSHPDVLKKVLQLFCLYEELKKEVENIEEIVEEITDIDMLDNMVKQITTLEQEGLNPCWVYDNKKFLEKIFNLNC